METCLCTSHFSRSKGIRYNFNTHKKYEGNREYETTTELYQLPLYVHQGTLLPLAEPIPCINTQTVFKLNCKIYGTSAATCRLLEDDGASYDFQKGQCNQVTLNVAKGKVKLTRTKGCKIRRYHPKGYEFIN